MIPNSENKRVWFITGASKGLGYAFTCAALKAGDKVVAVARTIDNLAKLEETYQESLGRCEQVPDMRSSYSSGAHPRGTS
ncbi:SDR family NAD(P)-dependent oxidoreductase [Klebsiella pneumoniae]|uniref:SDR family NAD(P)-dependent oxidoreductase n=1 Tax=Klebsiella pneumoniae TaxID=573 RepID=UPI000CF9CB38|nr:SDR family NAD(P)-dependent oxidoreductase [Klebsiella pneumoniae]ROA92639.1 SDR family NAD(P)-dependent oxidoreductase [Klebsiella pneumoniae subsp. pneumoniae]